jgi:hypothetical protein
VQLTTDGHKVYVDAVEDAFGADVDYAMLTKVYGRPQENETRYSPAKILSSTTELIKGNPNPKFISTSYVERPEPDDENGHPPLHAPDECVQQEG